MTKTGSGGDRKSSDKQPSGKAGRKSTGGGGGGTGGTKSAKHGHPTKASSSGQTGDRTHNSSSSAVAAGAKSAGTAGQSRSYPRGVGLDFRKLAGLTLVSYIDHHGVNVRPEAPPSELAVAVARHFEQMDVDEEECVGGLLERLEAGPSVHTDYARKTQHYPSGGDNLTSSSSARRGSGTSASASAKAGKKLLKKGKDGRPLSAAAGATPGTPVVANTIHTHPHRKRTKWAARPGEQVAAKVTRTDENGSWILASVQRFYPDTETYDVQDEDDTSKLIRLPWSHVMRLSTGSEGCFTTGAPECMAIFPETTSFYKARVAKAPVWKLDHGVPTVKEIIVKFADDEDGTGKTPHRRVPSRYVIPIPSTYFYDEQDDVDLVPPNSVGGSAGSGDGSGGILHGGGGGSIHHHHPNNNNNNNNNSSSSNRNNNRSPSGASPTSLIPSGPPTGTGLTSTSTVSSLGAAIAVGK